jgi:chromate transport protein ChrA
MQRAGTATLPTFREALSVWAKVGLVSFGGPAGQTRPIANRVTAAPVARQA